MIHVSIDGFVNLLSGVYIQHYSMMASVLRADGLYRLDSVSKMALVYKFSAILVSLITVYDELMMETSITFEMLAFLA